MTQEFLPIKGANYKHDYRKIFRSIAKGKLAAIETYRELCKTDLFFILYFGLRRTDINHPFIINCIREAEEQHDDTLDLWAREHYKSTTFTFGLPIQELTNDPEETIAIFSHTRPIAKGFLRQIKHTLETDVPLIDWFPEIFWRDPKKQAPKWSEDDGLIVKRKGTPKESSIEAWGLVDGQPTSKHFSIRIYDDTVTEDGVGTPDMIKKTIRYYQLSQSLGTDGGTKRVLGTHYHFSDLYMNLRKKGNYHVRIKPATHDGTSAGHPVFLSEKRLEELRIEQGPYIFSCQQLLNPIAKEDQIFREEWLRFYDKLPIVRNKYIIEDPANEKKKDSDFTVIACISLDERGNRFLDDLVRGRLDQGERWKTIREMVRRNPDIQGVWVEKYGLMTEIEYYYEKQGLEQFYFPVWPLGGNKISKADRIKRLVPLFKEQRFFLPRELLYDGLDLIAYFLSEEYLIFPYAPYDDVLDCLSRIEDPELMTSAPLPEQVIKELESDIKFEEAALYPGYRGFTSDYEKMQKQNIH